jgi:membrane-associated protease RseP (regulator of RpoE activity)
MMKTILSLAVLVSLLSLTVPAAEPASRPTAPPAGSADPTTQFVNRRLAVDLAANDWDAQQKAVTFLNSNLAHREAIGSLQQCRSCHGGPALDRLVVAWEPNGPWIGVSVGPADPVLRSQLRLPEGTGVVVTQVMPNSPAQQAGIEQDDVLLSVNGKPVTSGEDLDKILRSVTPEAAPLTVKLLRAGEAAEKQIVPRKADHQALVDAFLVPGGPVYRIGVLATEPDQTLRKQLKLGDRGLVLSEVRPDMPAVRAGVKAGDVLLSVNGKRVAKEEELTGEILRSGETPVELELLRGGVTLKIAVTPAREDSANDTHAAQSDWARVTTDPARELVLVHPDLAGAIARYNYIDLARPAATQPALQEADERLRQMTEQLGQVQRAVEALRQDLELQRQKKPEPSGK